MSRVSKMSPKDRGKLVSKVRATRKSGDHKAKTALHGRLQRSLGPDMADSITRDSFASDDTDSDSESSSSLDNSCPELVEAMSYTDKDGPGINSDGSKSGR